MKSRSPGGWVPIFLLVMALMGIGCSTVCYEAWEAVGVEKRDLVKKRVIAARDEQQEASEQFKDSLTRLKETSGFDGGQLEKAYNQLKSEYEDCNLRATAVRKRIKDAESVAGDLFSEWEKEIKQISTPSLAQGSCQQLAATKERYQSLHSALKSAEQTMDPVLKQFNDYVLCLKHNLNEQAIASLKGDAISIQTGISRLDHANEQLDCEGGRVHQDHALSRAMGC